MEEKVADPCRNLSKQDFGQTCRFCLAAGSDTSISGLKYEETSFMDIFKKSFYIEVNCDDELPKTICETCISEVIRFYNFKKTCEASRVVLLKVLTDEAKKANESDSHDAEMLLSSPVDDKDDLEASPQPAQVFCDPDIKEELEDGDNVSNNELDTTESNNDATEEEPMEKPPRKSRSKSFTCSCGEKFPSRSDLCKHRKEENHPLPLVHACDICKKSFTYAKGLRKHMVIHDSEKRYKCDFCGKKFHASGTLKRHIMLHTGERPHTCEFCQKGFIRIEHLRVHRRSHTGERPFLCADCGRSFRGELVYKAHIQKHSNKNFLGAPIPCKFCGKICRGENGYKNHLSRHEEVDTRAGRGKFECGVCHKFYASQASLNLHLVRHGDKNFLCPDCGKGFYMKSELEFHAVTHSDEKPYSCDVCGKTFSRQEGLKNHSLIHTDLKLYNCKVCGKKFRYNQHLKRHLVTHTGERPYVCKYCNKGFSDSSTLTLHTRRHTGERPYVCEICLEGFPRFSALKRHKQRHLNEISDANNEES